MESFYCRAKVWFLHSQRTGLGAKWTIECGVYSILLKMAENTFFTFWLLFVPNTVFWRNICTNSTHIFPFTEKTDKSPHGIFLKPAIWRSISSVYLFGLLFPQMNVWRQPIELHWGHHFLLLQQPRGPIHLYHSAFHTDYPSWKIMKSLRDTDYIYGYIKVKQQ